MSASAWLTFKPLTPDRWDEGFVGIASVFREAGFAEIEQRSGTRILMRMDLD